MSAKRPFFMPLALTLAVASVAGAEEPPTAPAPEKKTVPATEKAEKTAPANEAEAKAVSGEKKDTPPHSKSTSNATAADAPPSASKPSADPQTATKAPVTTRPRPARRAERHSNRVVLKPVDIHGRAARPQVIVDIPRKEPRFSVGTVHLSERAQRWLKPSDRR